jgi:hypothetical protein
MHLFVYYKFIPADYPNLLNDINHLQVKVSHQFPGLQYKLLKRPHLDDQGRETWMEQYDFSDQIFDQLMIKLNEEIAKIGSVPLRANEVFIDH